MKEVRPQKALSSAARAMAFAGKCKGGRRVIKLFEHSQMAYDAVLSMLKKNGNGTERCSFDNCFSSIPQAGKGTSACLCYLCVKRIRNISSPQ